MNYCYLKRFFFTSFLLSLGFFVHAEFIKHAVTIKLPAETEPYNRLIPVGNDFIFLQKDKSKEITTKKFNLVRYDHDINQLWSIPVVIEQFENVLDFTYSNNQANLITVRHNLDSAISHVFLRKYNVTNGQVGEREEILNYEIGDWLNNYGKAKVAQTFESAVASKQSPNEVTPLEYKFTIDYSLDSSKIICYQYDNSQDKLVVRGALFDAQFNQIEKFVLNVDDAHITYGMKVDHNGEVYLLKVSNKGKLAVLNVNLITGSEKYMTLPEGSTDKVNPRLYLHANHEVYLVYCNVKNDHLKSVSLATLNFDTETVDDTHLYKLDPEFLNSLNTHIRNGDKYFELAEIEEVNNQLVVLLEQHQIEGLDVHYHPNDVEKLGHWEYGKATINTGNMLVLVFDKNLDAKGQFTVLKNQRGALTDGMNTLSHRVFKTSNGLRFVYSNSKRGSTNNELHSCFLDLTTFSLSDVIVSTHGKKLVPVLTSTAFSPDGSIVFQTRKGILGRKNYLSRWHLNTHL